MGSRVWDSGARLEGSGSWPSTLSTHPKCLHSLARARILQHGSTPEPLNEIQNQVMEPIGHHVQTSKRSKDAECLTFSALTAPKIRRSPGRSLFQDSANESGRAPPGPSTRSEEFSRSLRVMTLRAAWTPRSVLEARHNENFAGVHALLFEMAPDLCATKVGGLRGLFVRDWTWNLGMSWRLGYCQFEVVLQIRVVAMCIFRQAGRVLESLPSVLRHMALPLQIDNRPVEDVQYIPLHCPVFRPHPLPLVHLIALVPRSGFGV